MFNKIKIIILLLVIIISVWIISNIYDKHNSIECDIIIPSNFYGNVLIMYNNNKINLSKPKKIKINIPENGISICDLKYSNHKIQFNYFIQHNDTLLKYSEQNPFKIKLEGFSDGIGHFNNENDTIKAGYVSFRVIQNGYWNDSSISIAQMIRQVQINDLLK